MDDVQNRVFMIVLALVVLALVALFSGVLTLPERPGLEISEESRPELATLVERNYTIAEDGRPVGELIQISKECGYVYVQCGVECEPDKEKCPPCDECVEEEDPCGYAGGAQTLTHLTEVDEFYGECCDGLVCIDGTCKKKDDKCVDKGKLCGYGPSTTPATVAAAPPQPVYYGECCEPYKCVDGYCDYAEECSDKDENCAPGRPGCCKGLICGPNFVCEPTTEDYCTDTDNGINADEKGTTSELYQGDYQEQTDYCTEQVGLIAYTEPTLIEYYCTKENRLAYTSIQCPYGCSDGVCLEITCTETDFGKDFFTYGHATGYFAGTYGEWHDNCVRGLLTEYYCDGNEVKSVELECEFGCEENACLQEAELGCDETDDGQDYTEQGTTTGYLAGDWGEYTDYCTDDGFTLVEFYCDADDNVAVEQHTCERQQCDDGECVG